MCDVVLDLFFCSNRITNVRNHFLFHEGTKTCFDERNHVVVVVWGAHPCTKVGIIIIIALFAEETVTSVTQGHF